MESTETGKEGKFKTFPSALQLGKVVILAAYRFAPPQDMGADRESLPWSSN